MTNEYEKHPAAFDIASTPFADSNGDALVDSEIACCLLSLYPMLFRLASVAGSISDFSGAVAGFRPVSPSLKFAVRSLNFPSDYSDARPGSIGRIRETSAQHAPEKRRVPG